MASSLFLLSYLMASLIIFSAAFTALGRGNPSQASLVVPSCNVLKLPSSALTQTTFTVPASDLSYADPLAWESLEDGFFFAVGTNLTNWGSYDVSYFQTGATYGIFYQVSVNQQAVTSTVTLTLTLPDNTVVTQGSKAITVVPGEKKDVQIAFFVNTYASGSIKFKMTSANAELWTGSLIINSVIIAQQ